MNVLLAHAFRGNVGWLQGKMVQVGERFNILNAAGNILVANATPGFLASLRTKGLLKEDDMCCCYCGDTYETCGCGAQCPDDPEEI